MRDETTIYNLILDIAKADERILAVYMNGSRTNPSVPRDIFQDYDIVYVVRETQSFIEDKEWCCRFGNILYMQYPDETPNYPSDKENSYGWLMQFDDGNRIDLTVKSLSYAKEHILDDKLCRILLDKENILPEIPPATDQDYYVKKPSEAEFLACANEFWWCTNNLAKGLWREEILYVQDMTNFVVRGELLQMLTWKVGILTNFNVSVGKSAKYLSNWISSDEYQRYLSTYFGGDIKEAWEAVLNMCDLFDQVSRFVGEKLGYVYNEKEAAAARMFLEHVRQLPKGAKEIFDL